ncbi:MAG: prolyl oligopeptidase family protein [Saprospiraceae bacterium]
MYKTIYIFSILMLLFFSCEIPETKTQEETKTVMTFSPISVKYPTIKKDTTIIDDYHGFKVADPYRWLEDDNSADTKAWVKTQNEVTEKYLSAIPFRETISKRLEEIWNYERVSTPMKRGDYYYYFKNDGLQNQSVMYRQKDFTSKEEELVLDPNKFSADGTASLGSYSFSKDGKHLAYLVSEGGSDWYTAYVLNLETGEKGPDKLEWIKFSGISWYQNGFYYSRYPEPKTEDALSGQNKFHQAFYHKLGEPQSEDQLVFADRSNPNKGFYTTVTEDEKFLGIGIWESTSGNALYIKNLETNGEFIPVMEKTDYDFNIVDNIGHKLIVLTNYKAANNRLILVNSKKPTEGYWEELIPESKDVLQSAEILGGKIVATYIHSASSKIITFSLDGKKENTLQLPGIGTVSGFSGKRDEQQAFYSFTSFTRPPTVYLLNMDDLSSVAFKEPNIDFDSDAYETKQVFYESMDGTKVPMFITHKKGLKLDGSRPTLLYGYGGFDISLLPQFNLTRLNLSTIFLENDGVYAVANLRGGGEFGKEWHQAGTKEKKQNVFNDFIAAAEHLIGNRYTSSEKLTAYGRSNGGLLIGATMTQRPDLFQVALPAVGVLDMLRYQNFTIGKAWAGDYGLSSNPKDFDYLYAYSPLHNIEKTKYPATLVTTADHDDRVVPAHSHKFISTLQAHQQGDAPVLISISTSSGHGAGKPTSMKIKEAADLIGFSFYNMKEKVKGR